MTETELVQGLKRGDNAARERLYVEHRPRLYKKASYLLGYQDPEIMDVVQEVFLAAFRGISSFEGRSNLATWLNHICANLCFARMRVRKKLVAMQSEEIESLLSPASHQQAGRAYELELEQGRSERLARWMDDLGSSCRELLRLRFEKGLALSVIKEELKLPLGTVASRLARCQESLKEKARRDGRG